MCGITGYASNFGVRQYDIDKMNEAISHRGPDDSGLHIDKTVGLGHQRLSIIDLDGGKQPMSNEDGTIWITFNGEIYNFQEIKRGLRERHRFRTKSDTEVILHLYEDKKERCLGDLRGMFAFAIYDKQERKLFLARDHLGQKPLYYFHEGNTFAFASEIKALLALKPELRELDCEALYEYLTLRIITPPRSMFRKIRKLAPGHFLVFQNGKVSVERFWNLRYEPKLTGSFEDILKELERQIEIAVRFHLVSDVPVGAFLSGGMDSSLVVAMATKTADERINTFSGDVPYEDYSELPHAREVANAYSTQHHELTISPSLVRTLPDLVWHLDEPSDPLSVCMYHISDFARREVKVALGGDGGDELFGGYDRYYGNVLVSHYALLPKSIRKEVIGRLLNLMPEGFWYRSWSHRLRWVHQMSFYGGAERYARSLGYFYFSDGYRESLYTNKFRKDVGLFDPDESLKRYFDSDNADGVIDRMLYTDSMTRMPDHPNMILDRMTMAHGLEARSPFLDHKLAEFCAAIPAEFKVRGTQRRYIQVELAKRYLPPKVIMKKKQGFSSPLPYLLRDEFRLLYRTFLNDSRLVQDGYLNQSAIKRLLEEHVDKKTDHGNRLWLLCNAEVWYRMYVCNEGRDIIREILN
jgi:asparagine synthase (glutamine-hydrolysing)